jgi:hypothetical protein
LWYWLRKDAQARLADKARQSAKCSQKFNVRREIHLSGGEITFLKALGLSGTPLQGRLFLARLGEVDENELLETLKGLMELDYVVSSKVNVQKMEDVERSIFRVNSSYSDDLREAMRPGRTDDKGARRRRRI